MRERAHPKDAPFFCVYFDIHAVDKGYLYLVLCIRFDAS